MPNFKYRYLSEDIPHGLVMIRGGVCSLSFAQGAMWCFSHEMVETQPQHWWPRTSPAPGVFLVAEIVGFNTPWIDKIILWAQEKLGKEYLVDGKLNGKDIHETSAPERFGFNLDQVVHD